MRYAIIDNGIVANIIALDPANASDFPEAVPGDLAAIGDEYRDGRFWRDGELVRTQEEIYVEAMARLADAEAALADLGIEPEEVQDAQL